MAFVGELKKGVLLDVIFIRFEKKSSKVQAKKSINFGEKPRELKVAKPEQTTVCFKQANVSLKHACRMG